MAHNDPLLQKIDSTICMSRLSLLAIIMGTDKTERMAKVAAVLKQLRPGAYLLGTGPSTVGIIPLSVDEITIGRYATILEELPDSVPDYTVNDMAYFTPFEVSRSHARIIRRERNGEFEFMVEDMGSTCGTFVNGRRADEGLLLVHGDVISLGPSQASTYIFYMVAQAM